MKWMLAVLLSWCVVPAHAGIFQLHLSPQGDDARDGLSEATAIRSLARAQELLRLHQPADDVEVLVQPGTYVGQSVQWTFTNGRWITFVRAPGASSRPVFDGEGGGTWFQLKSKAGPSRLRFRYLTVTHYWMAIDLLGDRDDPEGWNGENELRGMRFLNIGGVHGDPALGYSFAAVRLVNSRDNQIVRSTFEWVENSDRMSGYIHAIYVAHGSSRNTIAENEFIGVNGDAIRTRDGSNDNEIGANRFLYAGKRAVYSDWYCQGKDCSMARPECPSVSNAFRDNQVGDGYYGKVEPVLLYNADNACGTRVQPRVHASGTRVDE